MKRFFSTGEFSEEPSSQKAEYTEHLREKYAPSSTDRSQQSAIDWSLLSYAVVPERISHRAISVSVCTNQTAYKPQEDVAIEVVFKNKLPIPITIKTAGPLRWLWMVDEMPFASMLPVNDTGSPATFTFNGRERKRFLARWNQTLQLSKNEWEYVGPGSHEITAVINADSDRTGSGRSSTTIRIEQ